MWWATTSCSSRAMRCRSSSSARSPECRRSCSSSWRCRCAAPGPRRRGGWGPRSGRRPGELPRVDERGPGHGDQPPRRPRSAAGSGPSPRTGTGRRRARPPAGRPARRASPAGSTRLVQMRAAAENAHAPSGNRVRSASGAQVTNASSTSRPVVVAVVAGVRVGQRRVGDGEADQRDDHVGDLDQVVSPAPQPARARGRRVRRVGHEASPRTCSPRSLHVHQRRRGTRKPRPPRGVSAGPYPSRGWSG